MNNLRAEPPALPLHRRISEQLRREIASGAFEAGNRLPSEAELGGRFGVSRGTIRQALGSLRADGTIAGTRGGRPVVRGRGLVQPFSELLSFSAWVRSLGKRPGGRVIEFGPGPAEDRVARELGLQAGEIAHHLVRLRLVDDEPLMIERTSFPPGVGLLLEAIDLERESIYEALAARGVIVDSARQSIEAMAAAGADARLLGVSPRTPLLRVRRLSFSPQGRPLESSDDRYVGSLVSLTINHTAARPALARTLAV